jgi:hypothetical protein
MNGGIVEYLLRGAAILGRLEPDVDEATISLTEFRTTSSTIKLQSRSRSYFPRNLSIALKSQSVS